VIKGKKESAGSSENQAAKPLVGISTCLLGENVRYDGGHKLNRYLSDMLGRYVEFVPVCPEVECGLGIPREAMRLVDTGSGIRLMTQKTGKDITPVMEEWMKGRLADLAKLPLCGFIFKSKSPSSGLERVKVYKKTSAAKTGIGVFARGFTGAFPLVPVEEDGRLNDSGLRENFIERIFACHRWNSLTGRPLTKKALYEFHAEYKYMLMAHSPKDLKTLGAYIANVSADPVETVYETYFKQFITALKQIATVRKNTNVLDHLMGYFRDDLEAGEKQELKVIIKQYHDGLVPLIVPVTLINHYVRKYKPGYLEKQVYLHPSPPELMLRNHV